MEDHIPIQLRRVGATRTAWINIHEVCESRNIPIEVMLQRVATRIQKPFALDGNGHLLIKGKLSMEQMITVLDE